MKQTAQRLFHQALAAIDIPASLVRKLDRDGPSIRLGDLSVDLSGCGGIVGIAFGKAAFPMAEALTETLAPEFSLDGVLAVPSLPPRELHGWKTFIGGHPLPSAQSFGAGRVILERLSRCDQRTLVFFLISGGGSSLVEHPLDSRVGLQDFQELNSRLITCGAPIEEINVVRKHLSAIKGGRLAAAASGSLKITLAISDVPAGEESALASGPTLPDPSTVADSERIVERYGLLDSLPASIRRLFLEHQLQETPKAGDAVFARSRFELLLGERDLMHGAHHACEAEGYISLVDVCADNWPLEKAADHLLAVLESHKAAHPGRPVAVLADGEVISPVTGNGIGGRNSAFVLTCVPKIAGKRIAVLSAGTDGIDGNSPAAGAAADGESLARANEAALDPGDFLRRSDAYTFFARLGDAIVIGPTGNNLRDLRILLSD